MNCREASEWMSLHLDHRLTPQQVDDLHGHRIGCPRCQTEWQAMQRASSLLTGTPPVAPPDAFTARVMEGLARREARRRLFWGEMALLLGALALEALALPALIEALFALWPLVAQPALDEVLLLLTRLHDLLRSSLEICWLVATSLLTAIHPSFLLLYVLIALLLPMFWLTIMLPDAARSLRGAEH